MRLSRLTVGLVSVFFTFVMACSRLDAQDSSGNPDTAMTVTSAKIEKLQNELDAIKAQIDQLKKTQEEIEKPAAAPAASALAEAPSAPPNKPSLAENLFDSTIIKGSVDGYYGLDFEHPSSRQAGLRVFDNHTNQFSLNLAELVIKRNPDARTRLGYNLTLGYGNAIHVVNSLEPAGESFAQNVKEAYLSYLAPIGKGLQIDFGKFVTPTTGSLPERCSTSMNTR